MDRDRLRRLGALLQELVLPDECVGCGEVGPVLCGACRPALDAVPVSRSIARIPVTSALVYEGVVRRAVVKYKNEGRTTLARPLAVALRAAIEEALAGVEGDGIALVAMPRSRRSAVERGYDPVRVLLGRARLPCLDVLRTAGRTQDQLRLGREERFANLAGALVASDRVAGRRVLLVDDVVTTGATLAEARRAVTAAGGSVLGAATLAATP